MKPTDTLTPPGVDIPAGSKKESRACQRLAEAELDRSIRSTQEHLSHPHEPIEEFPSMRDPKSFALGLLMIVVVIGYCIAVQA